MPSKVINLGVPVVVDMLQTVALPIIPTQYCKRDRIRKMLSQGSSLEDP